MKLDKKDLLLYAVTDRSWLGSKTLAEQVIECVEGGATIIQLREKNIDDQDFINIAREIKKVTDKARTPFIINDNFNVALKVNADGVHIGQNDMEISKAREMLGLNRILGVSVQTVNQAIEAERNGADYLGVGAVFSTSTKLDANEVSYDMLKLICRSVSIPVIAIGGINENNMIRLKDSGICGVAVVSAIFAAKDIKSATSKLRKIAGDLF